MKLLLLLLLAANPAPDLDQDFERDVLIVIASELACHKIDVYLAESFAQRRQGLMFVRELPDMSGMLFLYERADVISMWMKNTLIPLDIVYLDANGSIVSIARNTEPKSLRSIPAAGPAQFALELNAGAAAQLMIGENSQVLVQDLLALRQ